MITRSQRYRTPVETAHGYRTTVARNRCVVSGGSRRRGFGYVRKLPSGRWQASYLGPDLLRRRDLDVGAGNPRVARSPRLSREFLVRLQSRRQRGELDSEVWDDITAMLDHFVPGYSPRLALATPSPTAASTPASATALPELIQVIDRLSAGLETGRIYDRDFATLGPALERLGNAWVRRTSR